MFSSHNSNDSRSFALLRRQSGVTLIESMAVMLVIVLLIVSIYIGVVYAEKQLLTNYRDRAATLLITGELEMEYYRHSHNKPFELQVNKQYVLDDLDPEHILKGFMTIEIKSANESSNEQLLSYVYLEGTFKWLDTTSNKERFIRMREDYFI
jgi:prepilin-type N-terminal cleavage/methylation domain-containing protein